MEFIALTPDRFDIAGVGGVDLQLLPQVPDVDSHGALGAVGLLVPDLAVEIPRVENLAGILHQELQDVVLPGRQVYRLSVHSDVLAAVVQRDAADGEHVLPHRAAAQLQIAPQLRAHPGQQLHGVELKGLVT